MLTHQPKFLLKLKASADAKREALDAECAALTAEQKSLADKLDAEQKSRDTERDKLAELVKDSTDKNRQFFALYLGLLVYVLLMVFSTTDKMLLVPTLGIKLPLVDVNVPLLSFYWVAPLFLLAIHFNLLQNLESHHYKLMRWRKACDGTVPRHEIVAFMFDYEWLERGSRLEWLVRFFSRILFVHSGPLALGILLWRFTDYQDIVMTSCHLLAFVFDIWLVRKTDAAFQRNEESDQPKTDQPTIVARYLSHAFGAMVLLEFGLACWFHFSSDNFLEGLTTLKIETFHPYGCRLLPLIRMKLPGCRIKMKSRLKLCWLAKEMLNNGGSGTAQALI
jgi:hypothetical protein